MGVERQGRQGGREGGWEARDLHRIRPHLQLRLQARPLAQERGHHVICHRELVRDPRAAAEQAWVDAIEVLVPKEAVLCPVLGHVLWVGDRAGVTTRPGPPEARDRGRPRTPEKPGPRPRPRLPLNGWRRPGWHSPRSRQRARPPSRPFGRWVAPLLPSRSSDEVSRLWPASAAPPSGDHELPGLASRCPHTGDDRLVGGEDFLDVLQPLP